MLKLPKYVEKDLDLFLNKDVIIYGDLKVAKKLYEIFAYFGVNVLALVVEKKTFFKYKGVSVINKCELPHIIEKEKKQIIQFTDNIYVEEVKGKFEIMVSEMLTDRLILSFKPLLILQDISKHPIKYWWKKLYKWKINRKLMYYTRINALYRRKPTEPVLIYLPPKTGDHTLNNTFNKVNNENTRDIHNNKLFNMLNDLNEEIFKSLRGKSIINMLIQPFDKQIKKIEYANLFHQPSYFNADKWKKCDTIKIITAVREPISQNMSLFYYEQQYISPGLDWIMGELENKNCHKKNVIINALVDFIKANGNVVEELFQKYSQRYIYTKNVMWKKSDHTRAIQNFIPEFNEYIINFLDYDFDKEKGYTIIKKDNIDLFVYQLERMNDILPELSQWVGVSIEELVMGNVGEDKWIGASYKQGLHEIEITQEYFDKCYNEPYVKHCYSEEDIEKFKERWKSHIRK